MPFGGTWRQTATTLFTLVALGMVACKPKPSSKDESDNEKGARDTAATEHAAATSATPSAGAGSPVVQDRRFLFAVNTKAPVTPQQIADAKSIIEKAAPGIAFVDDPGVGKTGISLIAPPPDQIEPPDENTIRYFGRGFDGSSAERARSMRGALGIGWNLDADPKLERLRAAQSSVKAFAEKMDGFIWDDATRELFTPAAFDSQRIAGWDSGYPDMRGQITIHYYENEGRHRAVTLGMEKFGAPDLVIQDVPISQSNRGSHVRNVAAQLIVEGASIGSNGELVLDLAAIKHAPTKAYYSGLDPSASHKTTIHLAAAKPEEGDAMNRLLEIRFPNGAGATEWERLAAAADALVGAPKDTPTAVAENDPELAAIKLRVQAKLPELAAAIQKGLPLGESISVKAPFDTDDGGVEWMWVSVTKWEGDTVHGVLDNAPAGIKSLKIGAPVTVKQSAIADYVRHKADDSLEGGESIKVLDRRSPITPR
ncbi:MAG: DUF2314 domain-containing protein [Polyangiaceae bacterium]|nr:DUF2314 domain-containing protein [Polyangiaceae bacterium]